MNLLPGDNWIAYIMVMNLFFILFTLSVERKNSTLALSWIMAMTFLPLFGFILYILFGTNALVRKKKILQEKKQLDISYSEKIIEQLSVSSSNQWKDIGREYRDFIHFNERMGCGACTADNQVEIFVTAKDKYRQLLRDIQSAKTSIHLLYFIIHNDWIGRLILDALAKKAQAGIKVRVLYDHGGSILTPSRTFKKLLENGAEVVRFFPIQLGNYFRMNFRNHRKIVVIDGKIGYLGGMNIGDEYMGLHPESAPWRDTHLRLCGSSVYLLQLRFLEDWQFAVDYSKHFNETEIKELFPQIAEQGKVKMQIVSSGPDTEEDEIKWNFMKMIYEAKTSICIQTPYFVPDDSFIEALKVATLSGRKVQIMAPSKTDNLVVHKVSLAYLGELLPYGVEVYFYPGFLHAKMVLIDQNIVSIGSANMDMRSFALNFEVNAFLYGKDIAGRCADIFRVDLQSCRRYTLEEYESRRLYTRMQEGFFRLIAPLM